MEVYVVYDEYGIQGVYTNLKIAERAKTGGEKNFYEKLFISEKLVIDEETWWMAKRERE